MQQVFSPKDYILLTKPRLVFSVILTAITSYVLAYPKDYFDWNILWILAFGVYLTASAAHILNQVYEIKNDALMQRTASRPLPNNKISKNAATLLALIFLVCGLILLLLINLVTSFICLLTTALYLYCYTPLKQKHFINTWIGAVPGALPSVLGWAAVDQLFDFRSFLFFALLFFWQICHFLALAWVYRDDYKKGGFKMLPLNDRTGQPTSIVIFLHGIVLLFVVWLFSQAFDFKLTIQIGLLITSVIFYIPMLLFLFKRTIALARLIFLFSVLYLPIFFTIIYINDFIYS